MLFKKNISYLLLNSFLVFIIIISLFNLNRLKSNPVPASVPPPIAQPDTKQIQIDKHDDHLLPNITKKFRQDRPKCRLNCRCTLQIQSTSLDCFLNDDAKFSQFHFGNFVCPQNFRDLSDWMFSWNAGHHQENIYVPEFPWISDCLGYGSIIYVSAWHLDSFLSNIYPNIQHPFVLITGESDLSVPFDQHKQLVEGKWDPNNPSSKIIHWFGQNGRKMNKDDRFTTIPIGLNCFEQARSIDAVYKLVNPEQSIYDSYFFRYHFPYHLPQKSEIFSESMINQFEKDFKQRSRDNISYFLEFVQPYHKYLPDDDPLKHIQQMTNDKLFILNFDPTTDSSGGRNRLWGVACGKEFEKYTTCISKDRGVQQYMSQMENIYMRNIHFPFWASPKGNGMDCHRTWESIYFGRIPVLLESDLQFGGWNEPNGLYDGLPVLVVEDWKMLTKDFLMDKFIEIWVNRLKGIYKFDKIKLNYWEEKILEKAGYFWDEMTRVRDPKTNKWHGKVIKKLQRPRRCWMPVNSANDDFD